MIHTEKTQTHARDLYFQSDLTTTKIAEILAIPRRTLHYWIKEKNWDRQKQAAEHMPALLAENCYHLIARFTEQLLSETRLMKPITPKEADALYKLTLTVNKLKNRYTLNESMELFGKFMDKINSVAPDLAKQVSPFVDECIANQSSKYVSHYRPSHFNSQGLIPVPEENVKEQQLDLADIMAWEEEARQNAEAEQIANNIIATADAEKINTANIPSDQETTNDESEDDGPADAELLQQLQDAIDAIDALGPMPDVNVPGAVDEYLRLRDSKNKSANNPPPHAKAA